MHDVTNEPQATTAWEQEIRALEESSRVAFLAADVPALEHIWDDEFLVNSPLNTIHDKRRVLELLSAGRIRHSVLDVEIEEMRRHGDTVVVMGRDRVVDPPDGTITRRRFTNIWQRQRDRWRTIARHAQVVSREPSR